MKVKGMKKGDNSWMYANTPSNDARFLLGQQLKKTGPTLICIGVNPSTAEPDDLDPTLARVRNRADDRDYARWVMLNLYPQRATDPNDMDEVCNIGWRRENLQKIAALIDSLLLKGPIDIWCAWGNLIDKRPYLRSCLREIVELLLHRPGLHFLTFGKETKKGNPHHPLFLKRKLKAKKLSREDINRFLI